MKHILRYMAVSILAFMVLFSHSHAGSNRVQVENGRLTVQVERMALEDLFETLAEATGIQFIIDEELARTAVSLDFEGLPLLDGIRRILTPLNHALIDDDSGRLSKVFIFGQGKASVTLGDQREGEDSLEDMKPQGSAGATSEREEEDSAQADQTLPEENEPAYFEEPLTETAPIMEGPPDSEEEQFEGPPETEDQALEAPPDMVSADNPPPDSSELGPMEGPPQD